MATSLFPKEMMATSELTLETILEKFVYFETQIHLLHLQTPSHAEHSVLNAYSEVGDSSDEILEKLMGYENRKVKAHKFTPIVDYTPSMPNKILNDLKAFAKQLESFAASKGYSDIENMAQSLSGSAAKTLYLLTQS